MFRVSSFIVASTGAALLAPEGFAGSSFATTIESYTSGVGVPIGFSNPSTTLGAPERFTGEGIFPGAVTPFNSPFGTDEIVSIGEGGSLVVGFDAPITDDPANPFGIDLLIFGNSFYFDSSFPNGVMGGHATEGGVVEVSQNGINWFLVNNVNADGGFPTLGYQDLAGPFDTNAGTIPTNFLKPVDPSFDPTGLNFAAIVAGYNGSGGGAGVDLATVGLPWIQFVRISNPVGSGISPEIDAFARVPSPASLSFAILTLSFATYRRTR